MLGLALVAVDHVRAVRLSREARDKALKHRSKVVQGLEKLQHAQRQEVPTPLPPPPLHHPHSLTGCPAAEGGEEEGRKGANDAGD